MKVEVERRYPDGDVVRLSDMVTYGGVSEEGAKKIGAVLLALGLLLAAVAIWLFLTPRTANAQPCPEGCIPASPTRTATITRTPPPTRTATRTRTATTTRTSTRTRIPSRTPTTKATPRATQTARLTATVASHEESQTYAASTSQAGAGPGRNSYRPNIQLDPYKLTQKAIWKAPRGQAIGRAQLFQTKQGNRILIQHGEAGFIDSPWVTPGTDHQCRTTARLLDLNLDTLSTAACGSTWSATFEGMWPAWWPHPTLSTYTKGRQHDGGPNGLAVSSTDRITNTLIGRYREEVGPTAVSERLDLLVTMNRRCWHGGSSAFVTGERLSDPGKTTSYYRGRAWNQTNQNCGGLQDGGIAIAESTSAVVATLNFTLPEEEHLRGLYAYDAQTGNRRCAEQGGRWSAPSVGPEGRYAYAVREGLQLVRMDTATCELATTYTASGITNDAWPQPPLVTDTHVVLVEPGANPRRDERYQGDLYAYRTSADGIWFEWTVDAGILSPIDLLSGFSRTDVFPYQADATLLYYAGHDALRTVDHRTGAPLPWMYTSPEAPEGFADPQLYAEGIVLRNAFRWRGWPECQRSLCEDGKPVGAVDYVRCCRGASKRCAHTDCAICEREQGWCANEDERYRVESLGTVVERLGQ